MDPLFQLVMDACLA